MEGNDCQYVDKIKYFMTIANTLFYLLIVLTVFPIFKIVLGL